MRDTRTLRRHFLEARRAVTGSGREVVKGPSRVNGVAGSSGGGNERGILISYLFCLARFPPTLLANQRAPLSLSLSLSGSVMQPPMDELKLCYVMRQKRGGQLGSVMPPINASCCSVNCSHPLCPFSFYVAVLSFKIISSSSP